MLLATVVDDSDDRNDCAGAGMGIGGSSSTMRSIVG